MTHDQIQHELDQMRQQEIGLSQEVARLSEQLTMTRGAVQMLEHLLAQDDSGAGEPVPSPAFHNQVLTEHMNGYPVEETNHVSAPD